MAVWGTPTEIWERPRYLKGYDVNAHDGRGEVDLTDDPDRALVWPGFDEVLAVWKMQSTVRPLRADGKPNRPVSFFTIAPERVPDGPARASKKSERNEK